jgi:hypothetical protein
MGKRPFTEEEFKKSIQAVLEKVPEEKKDEWLSEWIDQLSDSKKIEIYTSSLKTTSKRESLNFQGLSFKDLEEQIKGLDRSDLEKFNQTLMLEVACQKRVPFLFDIKNLYRIRFFQLSNSGKVGKG